MPGYILYTFFVALTLSLSLSCAMHSTRKWMVGILVSFWDVLFSEAMLVYGGQIVYGKCMVTVIFGDQARHLKSSLFPSVTWLEFWGLCWRVKGVSISSTSFGIITVICIIITSSYNNHHV